MIGKINRSSDFGQTLRYVSRDDDLQPIHGNTYAAITQQGADAISAEMNDLAIRSRSQRPCLHVSLSPEKGDHLSEFEWTEVAAQWTKGMGLESNQYAVYLHHDEDYGEGEQERPHAHIVANLVGEDGKQVEWDYPRYRSQEIIRDIERSMGLEQRPSSWEQTKDQEKEHDEQQQRFTEGDRELSAGAGSQQQPTRAKDGDRGRAES